MKIHPAGLRWTLTSPDAGHAGPLDDRLVPLLEAVAGRGTLAGAARSLDLAYRTAWGLLQHAERRLDAPLVALARGRGANLAPLGEKLVAAERSMLATLREHGAVLEIPVERRERTPAPARVLRVAASHDLALARLRDRWRVGHAVAIEFHGSAESLAAYAAGAADVAGFHVVSEADGVDPLLGRLRPGRDALIRFLRREQGLILAAGNPHRVRGLADVAARRLVLVNRQPGSGTRLLLDRMLARAGIDGQSLPGYSNEEFTHAAVAATIAAGNADVGLGVRAAAAQLKLAFVPLAVEHYPFACRRSAVESARIVAFRALLASDATRAVVTPLPGYRLDAPGTLVPLVGARGAWRLGRTTGSPGADR